MFKNIQLETERLVVATMRLEDDVDFHKILSQPEVMHFLPENVMPIEEVRKIVEWYQKCYEENTPEKIHKWTLGVWLKGDGNPPQAVGHPMSSPEDKMGSRVRGNDLKKGNDLDRGELIGWAGVGPVEFDESQVELFYGIAKQHWGMGYATEASEAVLDYAFGTIGLKRVVAIVNPKNVGSVKVAEKLGMTVEKTLVGLPKEFANDEGSSLYVMAR